MEHRKIGIAVIGSGRIGTLRASLAAGHPAVSFLAVSDMDPSRARALSDKTHAHFFSADNLEVISRPEVNAVIVSVSEHEHTLPVVAALDQGKPVLVEKPIALRLEDADRMLTAAKRNRTDLRVGYSRRFQRHYLLAKEQIIQGRLGRLTGGSGRVLLSRAAMLEILKRSPEATPVLDILTYYVNLFCWFFEGKLPVEVVARGQEGILKRAHHRAHDITMGILTFADGSVVSLSVFSTLPEKYPFAGQSSRIEILGTEGVMLFDEDHKEHLLYTDRGFPQSYVPGLTTNMGYLSSTDPGDWALGDFWGPLANETRAWLDYLSMDRPCALATGEDGRTTLEVTLAIEQSAQSKKTVRLPLTEKG